MDRENQIDAVREVEEFGRLCCNDCGSTQFRFEKSDQVLSLPIYPELVPTSGLQYEYL